MSKNSTSNSSQSLCSESSYTQNDIFSYKLILNFEHDSDDEFIDYDYDKTFYNIKTYLTTDIINEIQKDDTPKIAQNNKEIQKLSQISKMLNNNYKNYIQSNPIINSKDNRKKKLIHKKGDWICNKCKNLNFAFRKECNKCHSLKPNCELIN